VLVVPATRPLELFNWSPGGRVPERTLHWYGNCPPLADNVTEYNSPVVAAGSADVTIDKGGGVVPLAGFTVTVAFACTLLFATLTAITVTGAMLVTQGAVKRPRLEMVPALVHQITLVLLEFWTVAENCWVPFAVTVALLGEMEMVACAVVDAVALPMENPQDAANPVSPISKTVRMRPCAGRPTAKKF
jgi:hypothetical protein